MPLSSIIPIRLTSHQHNWEVKCLPASLTVGPMVQKAKTEVVGMHGWMGRRGETYMVLFGVFWQHRTEKVQSHLSIHVFAATFAETSFVCRLFVALRQLTATS